MREKLASVVAGLGLAIGLGVPIYWWITYAGLYRWLAEVQLGWFDGYYAILTGLLCVTIVLVPITLGSIGLAGLVAGADERRDDATALPAADRPVEILTPDEITDRAVRANSIGCLVVLSLVVLPVVGIGLWHLFDAARAGEARVLELAQLEGEIEGERGLRGRWVEFEARPAWLEAAGVKEKYRVTRYVPVRSQPERDAVIALALREGAPVPRRRWTGTLSEGAPGVVRSAFARAGRVRDPVWVLAVDETPHTARRIGWSMIEVGGGLLGLGLIVIGVLRRRWRRAGG